MRLVSRAPNRMSGPLLERLPARISAVGDAEVRRLLPNTRRTIGAWCFLDHFGPHAAAPGDLGVPPHPHIGLQTVTWLLQGEMLHLDSLGSRSVIAPGQLNWMTAGRGIAHAEENRPEAGPVHGVQLWVALPEAARRTEPAFDHIASVPRFSREGAEIALLVGALCGVSAEARTFSPLLAAEIALAAGELSLPVDAGFEHGSRCCRARRSPRASGSDRASCCTSAGSARRCASALAAQHGCCCSGGPPSRSRC
jgi:quercetin 2,3-dioxygenase